jgi:hypothetical protein
MAPSRAGGNPGLLSARLQAGFWSSPRRHDGDFLIIAVAAMIKGLQTPGRRFDPERTHW